jgi:hypothetical protein
MNISAVNFKINMDEKITLSPLEIDHVQSSWTQITDHKEFGIQVMMQMFNKHPETKEKFIFTKGLETEFEMRENSQLVWHAGRIIEIIDRVIKELGTVNSNEYPEIVRLGRNHFGYGVKPQNLTVSLLIFIKNYRFFYLF